MTDVERLAEIAHAHKIPLILDNTTATAYLFQGLKHGADIVVNSSSKYINGSSNSISGILTYSGRFQWDPQMYPQIAAYKSSDRWRISQDSETAFSVTPARVWHR